MVYAASQTYKKEYLPKKSSTSGMNANQRQIFYFQIGKETCTDNINFS